MGYAFTFEGFSGKFYDYLFILADDLTKIPRSGGNYIFARGNAASPEPVLISCADRVQKAIRESGMWDVAKAVHGAELIYVHMQSDERVRNAEMMDLIDAYQPPMNPRV